MIRGTRAPYNQLSGLGLNMFTDDELAELHRATLDVLQDAGLMVFNDEAQEILYSHGCKVDKETNIVKIPPYIVDEAIKSAPSTVLLAGRDPKYDIVLEGTRVGFANFGAGIQVLDLETGEIRESTKKDVAETALLCDALDGVDIYIAAVVPRDMPTMTQGLHTAEAMFTNCSKHCMGGGDDGWSARKIIEMAQVVTGSAENLRRRPIFSLAGCPVSPLQLSKEFCEVIIEAAKAELPCNMISMSLSGATAPVTNAGTLIVHNAEVLGAIVLSQLVRKGATVIYGSSTTMMDLTMANAPVGAPEMGMINAAVANLAQYYNLPSFIAGT